MSYYKNLAIELDNLRTNTPDDYPWDEVEVGKTYGDQPNEEEKEIMELDAYLSNGS